MDLNITVPYPLTEIFVVAWTGGYDLPSYVIKATEHLSALSQ